MELPFLDKKKNTGQVIVKNIENPDIIPHLAKELMNAIHSKDISAVREAIRALYHEMKED